jgi:hypothetical protein
MKAIAPNTLFGKLARNGKDSCDGRLSAMKCRIKASHLRQRRFKLCNRFYSGDVMGLMKRRQWYQFLKVCDYSLIDNYGRIVFSPAVNDAVSGGHEAPISEAVFQRAPQTFQRVLMACSCFELLICELIAGSIEGDESRLISEAVDLALA